MNPAPIKTKSKEERDAIFAKLFANLAPGDSGKSRVLQRLEEYREQIAAKRAEGYTLPQIAMMIRQEPVSIKTSPKMVRKFLLAMKENGSPKTGKKERKKPFILRPIIPLDELPTRK